MCIWQLRLFCRKISFLLGCDAAARSYLVQNEEKKVFESSCAMWYISVFISVTNCIVIIHKKYAALFLVVSSVLLLNQMLSLFFSLFYYFLSTSQGPKPWGKEDISVMPTQKISNLPGKCVEATMWKEGGRKVELLWNPFKVCAA